MKKLISILVLTIVFLLGINTITFAIFEYPLEGITITGKENGGSPMLFMPIPTSSTFTGTGNWSEPARWSNGVPGVSANAVISGNCTVNANYSVVNLTISNGYVLHIDPGHILTVTGTITNSAGPTGLILESDATGTGMLLNNTTGVQATVEQYLKKYQWHLMGIPVSYVSDVNDCLSGCYVTWMDESFAIDADTSGWKYLISGDSLLAMGGYAVRFGWDSGLYPKLTDTTIAFSGVLNTGLQDTIFASDNNGWNLISNPYPVTIDWDASTGIIQQNANDAFYVWNPNLNSGDGDYGSYGAYISGGSTNGQTQYIPPMQGFFLEVWAVEAGISFNNNCKVAVSSSLFVDAENTPEIDPEPIHYENAEDGSGGPSIKLAISNNGINFDETVIRVNNLATNNFDAKLDAVKLKALDSKLSQLYSVTNGQEYSINTIPEITNNTIVPLRVMINKTGRQQLSVKELKNIPLDSPLMIFDQDGKALCSLSESSFVFDGNQGEIKSYYLGFGNNNPEEIISMHQSVNDGFAMYSQVVVRTAGQGAFAVQKYNSRKSGQYGLSSNK